MDIIQEGVGISHYLWYLFDLWLYIEVLEQLHHKRRNIA